MNNVVVGTLLFLSPYLICSEIENHFSQEQTDISRKEREESPKKRNKKKKVNFCFPLKFEKRNNEIHRHHLNLDFFGRLVMLILRDQ